MFPGEPRGACRGVREGIGTMDLQGTLRQKREEIVQRWFDAVVNTYHEDAREPLRKTKAQFTNPVGYNFRQGLEGLFDGVLQGMLPDNTTGFLDAIVRIRAVQDFSPSQSLSFIFQLKHILREAAGPELAADSQAAAELVRLEGVVDDLALFAFDLYMQCREKIYDLKAQEARTMTFRLLQKAQLIAEHQE